MRDAIVWCGLATAALLVALPAASAGSGAPGANSAGSDEPTPRPPIVIVDDTMFTPANGVVDGSGTAADPYVISGWKIDGKTWAPGIPLFPSSPFPPGIYIQGTDAHVVLEDNHVLDNPRRQVWIKHAENVVIRDNLLERTAQADRRAPNDGGIHLDSVQDVTVRGNEILLAGEPLDAEGITLETAGPDVYPPFLRSGGDPLDVTIADNLVRNTGDGQTSWHGIHVDHASGVAVTGNTVENGGAVENGHSVEVWNSTDVNVSDNVAQSPGPANTSRGIVLRDVYQGEVAGNHLGGQDHGIRVVKSDDLRFEDNVAAGHGNVGVALRGGSLFTLVNNTIGGSGLGLLVDGVTGVTATENSLQLNDRGLSVRGSAVAEYAHDVDATNEVDGHPVRYHVGGDNLTLDGASLEAGYLALVSVRNSILQGTPALPDNGQGILVVGGSNVTVASADLTDQDHGTDLHVFAGRDHAVRNLTGTDAVLRDAPGVRIENSTFTHGAGDGLVVGPGSPGARLGNLTLQAHGDRGLVVRRSTDTVGWSLAVEGNGAGVLVNETDRTRIRDSSIALNTDYGLKAEDEGGTWTFVNATRNYWGHPDGPENYGGDGNAVVEGDNTVVLVEPVLSSAPSDVGDTT